MNPKHYLIVLLHRTSSSKMVNFVEFRPFWQELRAVVPHDSPSWLMEECEVGIVSIPVGSSPLLSFSFLPLSFFDFHFIFIYFLFCPQTPVSRPGNNLMRKPTSTVHARSSLSKANTAIMYKTV